MEAAPGPAPAAAEEAKVSMAVCMWQCSPATALRRARHATHALRPLRTRRPLPCHARARHAQVAITPLNLDAGALWPQTNSSPVEHPAPKPHLKAKGAPPPAPSIHHLTAGACWVRAAGARTSGHDSASSSGSGSVQQRSTARGETCGNSHAPTPAWACSPPALHTRTHQGMPSRAHAPTCTPTHTQSEHPESPALATPASISRCCPLCRAWRPCCLRTRPPTQPQTTSSTLRSSQALRERWMKPRACHSRRQAQGRGSHPRSSSSRRRR